MSRSKPVGLLRDLERLYCVGVVRDLTDGQILERLAQETGEPARQLFTVLVERHGSMVFATCRSILADPNDAWDAFQATFLVLLRKAGGL